MGICVRGPEKPITADAERRNPFRFSCFCVVRNTPIRRGAVGVYIKSIGISAVMISQHPDRQISVDGCFVQRGNL